MTDMATASNIALLAPVPKEHLDDGKKNVSEKGQGGLREHP
jgi:hypothetical protein